MPHPEREHELQIALATALRERDAAKDRAHQLNSVALERGRQIAFERERFSETRKELTTLKSERDALRAEGKRLRDALENVAAECSAQDDNFARCDQTTHQIARAALAAPAAAAFVSAPPSEPVAPAPDPGGHTDVCATYVTSLRSGLEREIARRNSDIDEVRTSLIDAYKNREWGIIRAVLAKLAARAATKGEGT